MIKLGTNSNVNNSNDFIEELNKNPLLKGYDINVSNANDFSVYLEELHNCNNCNNIHNCPNSSTGHLYKYENGEFIYKTCQKRKDELAKLQEGKLIKTLFVSKKILEADLSNFNVNAPQRKKIYNYIDYFISKTKKGVFVQGLYIYGSFSTGKTFILGCLANELARNNIESLLIYFPDLVVELKNALGTPRYEQLINYIKSVDVLLLDDFGSENMTSWLRDEVLGPVLNYRLMEQKPVFISSNINPKDQIEEHLTVTKAPSETIKVGRIKTRLLGLVKGIEIDNIVFRG